MHLFPVGPFEPQPRGPSSATVPEPSQSQSHSISHLFGPVWAPFQVAAPPVEQREAHSLDDIARRQQPPRQQPVLGDTKLQLPLPLQRRRPSTMEAASARYAARDRWGDTGLPAPSQLQRFIQAACSPDNYEPNLALNLEISDLINAKKGSTPREAAMAIVNLVNHRNPNISLLALSLLDICVKNCGYPFHLQISTKEFLNELVRRFPERPPIRPSRVQLRILEAIEEWRGTICETSRYKEDLGFIRDMHRLLSFKGYTFPEVRREDAAVLNPSDVCAPLDTPYAHHCTNFICRI